MVTSLQMLLARGVVVLFYKGQWFSLSWEACPAIREAHISVKELLPIVIACATWAKSMHNLHICCHCDNAAVVAMIKKKSSVQPLAMRDVCSLSVPSIPFLC